MTRVSSRLRQILRTVVVAAVLATPMFLNFDYQTMINAFDTHSHMFQLKAGKKF